MIVIVGCGFLGSYLLKHITSQTKEQVLATARNIEKAPLISGAEYIGCDVTREDDLVALAERCKNETLTVFYLAACHNIDYVYENPADAYKTNVEALKNFLYRVPNIKKLFFASTDCVYGENDKTHGKFTENALLTPINEYGKQKAEAEATVIAHGYTVLRLPFMLGPSLIASPHFYDKICTSLKNNESVEMIDGMFRSVLSYSQVAEIMFTLSQLNRDLPAVINICSDNSLSKYEMGCILAQNLNRSTDLVKKITEAQGKKFFKDRRAHSAPMDNTLLKNILEIKTLRWEDWKC
ncbi:MAG: NAD-dependent epimerase/dehydratase family protein [Acutalibacteraceae bacterium]